MKVAICTPCHGDARAEYALSLGRMLIEAGRAGGIELALHMGGSADLALIREMLAEAALADGADWLLWLDADQSFPPDTLARLLAAGKPVVGCNIARRSAPTGPTARRLENGRLMPVWTDEAAAREGRIERVGSMGLGVCLVSASIFAVLPRPWFRFEPPGEDVHFFARLREAGLYAYVDHGLSWEVGHIGLTTFTNADTIADKESWLAGFEG